MINYSYGPPNFDGAISRDVNQGKIGISTLGLTCLSSSNFCGCTGVVAVPVDGPGVLVGHISQTGNCRDVPYEDYLSESVSLILGLAVQQWGPVDAALVRGERVGEGNEGPFFPDLGHLRPPGVRHVLDLRQQRLQMDTLFYNVNHKVLHLWGGNGGEAPWFMDFLNILVDDVPIDITGSGFLAVPTNGKGGMEWREYQ